MRGETTQGETARGEPEIERVETERNGDTEVRIFEFRQIFTA